MCNTYKLQKLWEGLTSRDYRDRDVSPTSSYFSL